jgi:hypothetical protein
MDAETEDFDGKLSSNEKDLNRLVYEEQGMFIKLTSAG